ncbi:MAG: nitrogen fixation protein NifU [Candidatus Berkelbacteria bacterium Licking1014_7]|uniref:Nitrogen fixation protein NifU n=1 Tax=Candidatus Berkelbacteria bacterium Licking1014_7 TaxID=2017147 RepID=A0A554LIU7_9BACT|nr:MAG: nitrogen fixation protein NifU [Candidatus Berkelbacteria bacterium Licking1014_7]
MKYDIVKNSQGWVYSETVKKHFFHPKNFIRGDSPRWKFNGYGESGSAACGDVMRNWIFVDKRSQKINRFGWKTYGCASAIASTSILSEMLLENGGMKINDALKITPTDILDRLGDLPIKKVHCSVLGDRALKNAIADYFKFSSEKMVGK